MSLAKAAFVLIIIFCLSPWGSPPAALAAGIVLAMTLGNPFPQLQGRPARLLLQASVVLLGFGMNLEAVIKAGKNGVLFTIVTIFGTLILGYFVGKALKVKPNTSSLISSGTAICGGSAIAAVAPVIDADPEEMSVALGTVFILNSIALIIFPYIGHAFSLSEGQFGVWAAVAIHDTSSVVGAAQAYGAEALSVATTVKLARALWIAPVAILFLYLNKKEPGAERRKIVFPWFIVYFLAACTVRTFAPSWVVPSIYDSLVNLAKAGMVVTLFLIGASLSRATIRKVGLRPLLQGVVLWVVISVVALFAVIELL
ncbi:MAG: putative sulfate exporter family transporter [Acidobacteriota bacterium]